MVKTNFNDRRKNTNNNSKIQHQTYTMSIKISETRKFNKWLIKFSTKKEKKS